MLLFCTREDIKLKLSIFLRPGIGLLLLLYSSITCVVFAQNKKNGEKIRKASQKVESGFEKNNPDTLAQGYFDLGESY